MLDDVKAKTAQITRSFTFKGITIAVLVLLLLIPGAMIQALISERQQRSRETIREINQKWSSSQTLCAPLLLIPYTTARVDKDNKPYNTEHTLYVTPKELQIDASLTPEERYYGIYKAILYKSDIRFKGNFSELARLRVESSELHFDKARIAIGITDLKGVTRIPDFKIDGETLETNVGTMNLNLSGGTLIVSLQDINLKDSLHQSLNFECAMQLNGSASLSFIPVGQNTSVTVDGQWQSPSFIGGFSPESTIDNTRFNAVWNILSFNREIPVAWSDNNVSSRLADISFGVNLDRDG